MFIVHVQLYECVILCMTQWMPSPLSGSQLSPFSQSVFNYIYSDAICLYVSVCALKLIVFSYNKAKQQQHSNTAITVDVWKHYKQQVIIAILLICVI